MKSNRAFVWVPWAIGIAAAGVAAWLFKPKAFDGDSRRAKENIEATTKADSTLLKQGATAASKVATVKEVIDGMSKTWETEFGSKELGSALGDLPKPDPEERLKSIDRKLAVMSGNIEKINELYAKDQENSAKLQKERDDAVNERTEIQNELSEVAAERLGASRQRNALIFGVVLLGLAAGYFKFFGINRSALGRIAADIRAGADPIQTFDTHLAPWMHAGVNKASRLATPHTEK